MSIVFYSIVVIEFKILVKEIAFMLLTMRLKGKGSDIVKSQRKELTGGQNPVLETLIHNCNQQYQFQYKKSKPNKPAKST